MPIPSKTSFTGSASSRSKVFETACAAEGAKSLQSRWEVIVCPNIVAQIGQHMAEDHCLQVHRDDAAGCGAVRHERHEAARADYPGGGTCKLMYFRVLCARN